jgi:hypothetical protein
LVSIIVINYWSPEAFQPTHVIPSSQSDGQHFE